MAHTRRCTAIPMILLATAEVATAFLPQAPAAASLARHSRAVASARMPLRRVSALRMQQMGGGDKEEVPLPLSSGAASDLAMPGGGGPKEYKLYPERWTMLTILSVLALLSDWACFATAGGPKAWSTHFGHNPEELIDLFLFVNVATCFFFTDITRKFGFRKVIVAASGIMALGCLFRSGDPSNLGLPEYWSEIIGTMLVGASQPFFQCSPPLLSGTWFGQDERALSTSICLNANQLGIATAFVVGGFFLGGQAVSESLDQYLTIITGCAFAAFAATAALFKERPPTPPTASAAKHTAEQTIHKEDAGLVFPSTVQKLLKMEGFTMPLAAFVCSIGLTNVVSTFTSETMERAGFTEASTIIGIGAAFQVAIMAGGILLGGYVDQTKRFKEVTLGCFGGAFATLMLLGVAEGNEVTLPPAMVIGSLVALGAFAGPIQPINAELAVEVSYPEDECAVEATQQLSGNLFSALLVPICLKASTMDWTFNLPLLPEFDMKGDSLVLLGLTALTAAFFSTFKGELRREAADQEADPEHVSHIADPALRARSLHLDEDEVAAMMQMEKEALKAQKEADKAKKAKKAEEEKVEVAAKEEIKVGEKGE